MKIGIGLIAAAVVCGISPVPVFAKTAKECTGSSAASGPKSTFGAEMHQNALSLAVPR